MHQIRMGLSVLCLAFITHSAPVLADESLSVLGRVVERQGGAVAASVAGPVESVSVIAGDKVRKGDVLAILNFDDKRADLRSAKSAIVVANAQLQVREAALNVERANYNRLAALKGSAAFNGSRFEDSEQEVLRLRADIAVARALIEETKSAAARILVDIRRAKIVAPFDGVVTSREIDDGDYVTPGRRMFTLVNLAALEVEADIPASFAQTMQNGARLEGQTRNDQKVVVELRTVIPVENALTRTRTARFVVIDGLPLAVGEAVELILDGAGG